MTVDEYEWFHWGPDPSHGGQTKHKGSKIECSSPDCRSDISEIMIEDPTYLNIKYKKSSTTAKMPTYAHSGDAGMGLYADKDITLYAYHRKVVPTGIAMEIPYGYFGMIRPRSGLAVKDGITCISSGVIDAGYRGEIKVLLMNHGHTCYEIARGDRVAQMLILPVMHTVLEEVNELSKTERFTDGHGSTGK
mgnify:CR=1 FL=1